MRSNRPTFPFRAICSHRLTHSWLLRTHGNSPRKDASFSGMYALSTTLGTPIAAEHKPSFVAVLSLVCDAQHVAQCEVLPRGEGPSPDIRVNTQLRVPVQPTQTLEHLTATV